MTDDSNRRQLDRHPVTISIDIIDQGSGQIVGKLVNIHSEGLMIACENTLIVDHIYEVLVQPQTETEGIAPFVLGIDCLWVGKMSQDEGYWVGCKIISVSPESLEKIQKIVHLFES